MQGPDVLEVQKKLARLGFNPGTRNGIYDENTAGALRRFQAERGLKADGLVGPLTWTELNQNDSLYLPHRGYPAPGSPKIHIHVDTRILTLTFKDTIKIYPVGVGKPSTPSPAGTMHSRIEPGRWQ
jgi:Putative peptidoglycan-binding domain-containing protein